MEIPNFQWKMSFLVSEALSGQENKREMKNYECALDWLNFRKSAQITSISSEDSDFVLTWRKEQKKVGVPP